MWNKVWDLNLLQEDFGGLDVVDFAVVQNSCGHFRVVRFGKNYTWEQIRQNTLKKRDIMGQKLRKVYIFQWLQH